MLVLLHPAGLCLQEFLDAWEKLEDATKQEKGVRIFDLKKPATNNYMFIGYGEWECGR